MVAYLLGVGLLLWRLLDDIDPRYRESAEESLVETAHLLAAVVEQQSTDAGPAFEPMIPLFQSLYARDVQADIFGIRKERIDLRVTVVDAKGLVLFDSRNLHVGADFSRWRDVRLALLGEYGARTSADVDNDPKTSVMYVSAPIYVGGRIVGAVSAGKPVQSFGQFVDAARRKTLLAGLAAATSALILALILSMWLVVPHGFVGDYIRYLRLQRHLNLPQLSRHTREMMSTAYRDMRDALAGRSYAADYVQTLTHELKSPLSTIRGAAELLQEPMPEADRKRFLDRIDHETERIQELVDRMMELAALESRRRLDKPQPVAIVPLLADLAASTEAAGAPRDIRVRLDAPDDARVSGDEFLLRRAVRNLLDNALDFSPPGGLIVLCLRLHPKLVEITVRDAGPGMPHYAGEKVFEKFYSLARPGSTRRSTGLGLPFVREVAHLHHGRATLHNLDEGGAVATLILPRLRSTAA